MGLPKLTSEKINQRLVESKRDIICITSPSGYHKKVNWQCKHGHVWRSTPSTVLANKHGCPECNNINNDKIDKLIKDNKINITRNGDVKYSNVNISWKCDVCANVWDATPNKIIHQTTRCPNCSGKKKLDKILVNRRIHGRGIALIGKFTSVHTKTQWECKYNHVWSATPASILYNDSSCPYCYAHTGGRGIPVNHEGIHFKSQLECAAYIKLLDIAETKHYTIELQKRYNSTTKHTCDFYIPEIKTWIEISNYSSYEYLQNINNKRKWVEAKKETFYFSDCVSKLAL